MTSSRVCVACESSQIYANIPFPHIIRTGSHLRRMQICICMNYEYYVAPSCNWLRPDQSVNWNVLVAKIKQLVLDMVSWLCLVFIMKYISASAYFVIFPRVFVPFIKWTTRHVFTRVSIIVFPIFFVSSAVETLWPVIVKPAAEMNLYYFMDVVMW